MANKAKDSQDDVQILTTRTEEGIYQVLDFVANGIANNRLTYKQGDALNTTAKTALSAQRIKQSYFKILADISKKENLTPEEMVAKIESRMPGFFVSARALPPHVDKIS